MRILRYLVSLGLLLLVNPVSADVLPEVVGIHVVSRHTQSGKDSPGSYGWNNNNEGVYAKWNGGFTFGHYVNSLFRNSLYAGWTISDKQDRFSIIAGLVSGYDRVTSGRGDYSAIRCESVCREVNLKRTLTPLLVPSMRIGITDTTSLRLSALVPPGNPAAVHLSIEARFN